MKPGIEQVQAAYDLGYEHTVFRVWPMKVVLQRAGHIWEYSGRWIRDDEKPYRKIRCRSCPNKHALSADRSEEKLKVLKAIRTALESFGEAVFETERDVEGYGGQAVYAVLDGNFDAALRYARMTAEAEARLLGDCQLWSPLQEVIKRLARETQD
jgi:hypothetical protein